MGTWLNAWAVTLENKGAAQVSKNSYSIQQNYACMKYNHSESNF